MKLFNQTERQKIRKILKKSLKRIKQARKDIEAIEQTKKLSPRNDNLVRVVNEQLNPIRRRLYAMVHFKEGVEE